MVGKRRNKLLFLIAFIMALKLINAQVIVTSSLFENISSTQQLNVAEMNNQNFENENSTNFVTSTETSFGIFNTSEPKEEGTNTKNQDFTDGISNNTNQQQNISNWWLETKDEVNEMLLYTDDCTEAKYSCYYNNQSSWFSWLMEKECKCDDSCNVYGECCIDEAATTVSPKGDQKYQQMICGQLNALYEKSIFMIGECVESMKGTTEDSFCHQKVPLDSYEVTLDIPVVSLATNYTYRNYYCAICNNDSESLLETKLLLTCNNKDLFETDTLESFLQNATYKPGKRTYIRDQTIIYRAVENEANLFPQTLNQVQTCYVEVAQYKNVDGLVKRFNSRLCSHPEKPCEFPDSPTSQCAKQVKSCNSSWSNISDFEKCSSYSLTVYNSVENVLYKNPHCAKCNFVNRLSMKLICTDLNDVFQVFHTTRVGPTFSVLFELQGTPSNKCQKSQDIWNPFTNKCSEIVCGSGRIFKGGKCVEEQSENLQSHNNTNNNNSTLKNNCPTVALDNFTIYENDSAYSSQSDKHYINGEYELYNDSAILVCIDESYYYKEFSALHYYTTIIVLSISLVCLAFHIILYFCFKRMRTWHGKNLLCLCGSLFVAQLLFLTGITATDNFGFCVIMAVCLHYFWLASFCWMNVLSFDVWRTFRSQVSHASTNKKKLFLYYSLYSWGIPFIIVTVGLALDLTKTFLRFRPQYAGHIIATLCWINNRMGLLSFFLIPVGIIIIENLILYIITSYQIYIQSRESHFAQCKSQSVRQTQNDEQTEEHNERMKKQEKQNQTNKIRFSLYLRLGILQGMTWLSGFLATFINSSVCWYIFTIMNGLQGAVIVLCFDIKKWVFLSMWENISKGPLSKWSKITKSTSPDGSEPNKKDNLHNKKDAEEGTHKEPEKEDNKRCLKSKYSLYSLNLSLKRNKEMVAKRFSLGPSFGCRSYENPSNTDMTESGIYSSETTNTGNTQITETSDFVPTEDFRQPDVVVENQEFKEKL